MPSSRENCVNKAKSVSQVAKPRTDRQTDKHRPTERQTDRMDGGEKRIEHEIWPQMAGREPQKSFTKNASFQLWNLRFVALGAGWPTRTPEGCLSVNGF